METSPDPSRRSRPRRDPGAEHEAEIAWLEAARRGTPGTVGSLVPDGHPGLVRIAAPDAWFVDWVGAYRDLFARVACTGVGHTSTPNRAWFAYETGNEFGLVLPPAEPGDDAAIGRELLLVVPDRRYRLASGTIESVLRSRHPVGGPAWRHPDLFWPADRSWFVATDVDFWSLYVAGPIAFVERLAGSLPLEVEAVTAETPLVFEE